VPKRYHPPQTPRDRLLQAASIPDASKIKLREVAGALDPLKLLEGIRATEAHLVVLADGGDVPIATPEPQIYPASSPVFPVRGERARFVSRFPVTPSRAICAAFMPRINPMSNVRPRKTRRRQLVHDPSDRRLKSPKPVSERPKPIYAAPGIARVSRVHDDLVASLPPSRRISEHRYAVSHSKTADSKEYRNRR